MSPIGGAPKVSVGMPVYNAERYLEDAIDSILGQSFEDLELVISDNASTDATAEICRRYADKDERVRYFRNRMNYGIAQNFNTTFRLSSGRYFKWAAGDDVCARDYLARAVEVLDADPSVVLTWPKTHGIDGHGNRVELGSEISDLNAPWSVYSTDPVVRFRRLVRNWWWADGPFYGLMRAGALAETGLHAMHTGGDQFVLVEMSLKGRFYEISEELFFVRLHTHKSSHSAKTLRQRAALAEGRAVDQGIFRWWIWIRGYPQRILGYVRIVARSRLEPRKKIVCYWEAVRPAFAWTFLRTRQLLGGRSPWQSSRRTRRTPS